MVAISGLTLEGGGGLAYGINPGVNTGSSPQPYDSDGGAILNLGTLTVSGCTLIGNSTHGMLLPGPDRGGAIYNAGTLTLTGSTLSGNSALYNSVPYLVGKLVGKGGAVYNVGTATISGCTISGNSASYGYGGGVFNWGTLTVSGCNFSANSASYGGGIYSATVPTTVVSLSSDTVESNTAKTAGGGIYIASGAAVYLDAFTVANAINNTAPTDPNIDGSFQMR
jgi:predicted outer membrane repeat protein